MIAILSSLISSNHQNYYCIFTLQGLNILNILHLLLILNYLDLSSLDSRIGVVHIRKKYPSLRSQLFKFFWARRVVLKGFFWVVRVGWLGLLFFEGYLGSRGGLLIVFERLGRWCFLVLGDC